jgi:hypothetical protein
MNKRKKMITFETFERAFVQEFGSLTAKSDLTKFFNMAERLGLRKGEPLPLSADMEYHDAIKEIEAEAAKGRDIWGAFNSAHEAYGVLLEEVDELKAHVWMKQKDRDLPAMRKEAMQVAAMALRFMIEVCDEERGRK